jgi:hypothetical protein
LGLHISKKLVELHGGRISVVSEYGAGSEFIVKLPVSYLTHESKKISNPVYIPNNQKLIERMNVTNCKTNNSKFCSFYF